MRAIVTVRAADGADLEAVSGKLMGIEGVERAYELSGGLDMMLMIRSESASGMKSIIDAVKSAPEVREASSFLVIGEKG